MKENNDYYTDYDKDKLNSDETTFLNKHEKKMDKMIENSQNIVKQIKQMNQEISSDLQFQNKLISEIGLTVSKTDSELKKNNSKIDEILLRTSTCSLIVSIIIQVFVIIFLILL